MAKGTRKRHKYGARKTEYMGIIFDSAAEALRYSKLLQLESDGHIMGLELQPKYAFIYNGEKLWDYIADFAYWEVDKQSGVAIQFVVEDVKSEATAKDKAFILKKKAFLASSVSDGIDYRIVTNAQAGHFKKLEAAPTDEKGVLLLKA